MSYVDVLNKDAWLVSTPSVPGRHHPREPVSGDIRRKCCRGSRPEADSCSQLAQLLDTPLPSHSALPPGTALLRSKALGRWKLAAGARGRGG